MAAYRVAWWSAVHLLGGLCSFVALLNDRVWATAGAAVLVALSSAVASYVYSEVPSAGACCRQAARAGGFGFLACFAAAGLVILVGLGVGLLVLVMFVVVSPPVQRCRITMARRLTAQRLTARQVLLRPSPPSTPQADRVGPRRIVPVRSLSDVELCLAWCLSSIALEQHSPTAAGRAMLVAARQGYLDELERRDPEGFQRWLDAGAGPSSDPSQYLRTVGDRPAADDGYPPK